MSKKNYVIERKVDGQKEWWTGSQWSDVDTDAKWYTEKQAQDELLNNCSAQAEDGDKIKYDIISYDI